MRVTSQKSLEYICIWCGKEKAAAESHIVPNSLRKRLWGIKLGGGVSFKFKYLGEVIKSSQDFPTAPLMCKRCDSDIGGRIEKKIPDLIIPRSIDERAKNNLPFINLRVGLFNEKELFFPAYDYFDPDAALLDRFSVLVAWRVIHVELIKETPGLKDFCDSKLWSHLNLSAKKFISGSKLSDCDGVARPDLWFLPPEIIYTITKSAEDLPISWGLFGKERVEAVMVLFGFWLIFWRVDFEGPQTDTGEFVASWMHSLNIQYSF